MGRSVLTREAIDQAADLFSKGEKLYDVMRKTGVTKHTAMKLRDACGYTPVGQRILDAIAKHPNGNPVKISQVADCTYTHARNVMRRLGL